VTRIQEYRNRDERDQVSTPFDLVSRYANA